MEPSSTLISAGEALAEVERVLDRVDPDRSAVDGGIRLDWVRIARRVRSRVEALTGVLTAEADRVKAAETAAGTPLASWLGMGETLSRREAAGAVRQARRLGRHPLVGAAAVAGKVGTGQARAIAGVLEDLADQLDPAQQTQAEQVLVGLAGHLDADQLAKSAGRVLKAVAPARTEELLEQQLQRQAEQAYRQRSLRFFQEGAKVRFDGCLPRPEAERWMAQLDACQAQQRRIAIETRDRLADTTPEQRRADALIALIQTGAGPSAVGRGEHAGGTGNGDPNKDHGHGSQPDSAIEDGKATGAEGRGQSEAGMAGPTARVLVKLDYDRLVDGAAAAGLLVDGQPLSAGELRRLCCDAEVIPIVLGAESEILDVGRTQRLVTPALRAALVQRDGGCVFPGCDAPPSRCEAHHVVPWYLGGPTELWKLRSY